MAKAPACTATSARISQTLPRPSRVCASRPERHHPGDDRGPEVQRAAVDDVGDRAAVQPEHDDRHQPGEAEEADVERGVRQGVDLHRHGDLGEHRTDERGALADQQPPVGHALQRTGVDRVVAQQRTDGAAWRGGGLGNVLLDVLAHCASRCRSTAATICVGGLVGGHLVGEDGGLDALDDVVDPASTSSWPSRRSRTIARVHSTSWRRRFASNSPCCCSQSRWRCTCFHTRSRLSFSQRAARDDRRLPVVVRAAQEPQRAGQFARRLLRVVARARRRTCSRRSRRPVRGCRASCPAAGRPCAPASGTGTCRPCRRRRTRTGRRRPSRRARRRSRPPPSRSSSRGSPSRRRRACRGSGTDARTRCRRRPGASCGSCRRGCCRRCARTTGRRRGRRPCDRPR